MFGAGGRTYALVTAFVDGGVQVINMTDPANPAPVSAAFDGSDGFEALGGALGVETFASGNSTYAIVAAFEGVQVIDITDPANMVPISAAFDDTGGFEALGGAAVVEVFVVGDRTYAIVAAFEGVQVIDITDPANMVPISAAFDGMDGFGALYGAADVEVFGVDGRTYAVVTAWFDGGVQVMDITDPARIIPISAAFDDTGGFEALGGANGMAVFESGDRTYAVVAASSDSGVQIMDIAPVQDAGSIHLSPVSAAFDDTGGFEALYRARSMDVFGMDGRPYAVVVSYGDGGAQIINMTDPANPAPVSAAFDGVGGFEALGGAADVEVFGMNGRTYAMVAAYYDNGVQVINVTDPANPAPVSVAYDGMNGFEALGGAADVEVFGMEGRTYAMVAALHDHGVQVINMTDPANPAPVSAAFDDTGGFEALGGAVDVGVFGAGGRTYAMVAALHDHGVQVIDITDPAHPVPISAAFDGMNGFEALGGAVDVGVFGAGGRTYAMVAALHDHGVQVIDITDPAHPVPISAAFDGSDGFWALGEAADVEVFGMDGRTYAMVAARDNNGVQIINMTDPANPAPISAAFDDTGGFEALRGAVDVGVFGAGGRTYAVVAAQRDDGVQIINMTDPANPAPVSAAYDGRDGFEALYGAWDVEVFGMDGSTYAVVAAWDDDGVQIINMTDPANPAPVSAAYDDTRGFEALDGARDVEVFDMYGRTYAMVAARIDDGVQIIDVTDPANPAPVSAAFDDTGGFEALGGAADVEVFGMDGRTYAVVAAWDNNGVQIIDVTDPANPAPVSAAFDDTGGFEALGGAADVEVFGMDGRTYAVVAAWDNNGVQIIDVTDPANPAPVSAAFDDTGGFEALGGAADVEVFGMDGRTYAVVAALHDDGVQVLDITDPASIIPISAALDYRGGFGVLGGARSVDVFGMDGRTYAVVAARDDDGVQIINMTDPANPAPVSAAFDDTRGFEALGGATDVEVFDMYGRTYAMVAAGGDGGVQIVEIYAGG